MKNRAGRLYGKCDGYMWGLGGAHKWKFWFFIGFLEADERSTRAKELAVLQSSFYEVLERQQIEVNSAPYSANSVSFSYVFPRFLVGFRCNLFGFRSKFARKT